MKKPARDSSVMHFIVMIGFGLPPFYLSGVFLKIFWDSVPTLNKMPLLDWLNWKFAVILIVYVVVFTISFYLGAHSKYHADILYKRIIKVYEPDSEK